MAVLCVEKAGAAPWGSPLLADIEVTLAAGEVLAILGPNGAGKSTLLHTLAGGIAHSGRILLGGRELSAWARDERARALALLPQQSPLNFPFSVEEVIQLGRTPHASGAAVDSAILAEVMDATDTTRLRQRLYTRLSGGERQRVQLARVLAQLWRAEDSEVRLLLLDEPTGGLDLEHQRLIMDTLARLAAQGCAVVMVLHDFNLAASRAQQLLVLQEGRQARLGSPQAVLTRATFREIFQVDVHIGAHPRSGAPLVLPT
ncbi:heme ABC transporter ATP-binding protein [Parahaliea aestuarii]|uniref:Heme ABC transporter ATP-binding protein n=1 Tax=Parahaliea aestuarii TaxID=1852021 RepID=A0A5C8ZWB5_9GAMM|nr:heme ABC transporter ATP-binding protein [Parahaliea aestuarii]TXS91541.1 heme ABC transporter ATP-binding protein [Parahaliea aestuarii]